MRILTRKQSQDLDQISRDKFGISGQTLMGKAGKENANVIIGILEKNTHGRRIFICCGKGNNGGDGFSAALHLTKFDVTIYFIQEKLDIAGNPQYFYNQCVEKRLRIIHGSDTPANKKYDFFIDGLTGTGFKGKMREPIKKWAHWINSQNVPVVSIDIPSGVNADNGTVSPDSVKADFTVTMGWIKTGMKLNPGVQYCGEIIQAEIGFPDILDDLDGLSWRLFQENNLFKYLPVPKQNTYKHRQGKVLIIAGSIGMTGASILSSNAAIRSGAGLTKTVVPRSLNSVFETNIIEGMTIPCNDEELGYLTLHNFDEIKPHLEWCDSVLIGPGLGTHESTKKLIENIIFTSEKPMVIDADGLQCFENNPKHFQNIKVPFVITPHYGEMASVFGTNPQEIAKDLPKYMESIIKEFSGVIVAKNAPTCTGFGQEVVINNSGNPGLATAGTGDVLAGIITSFIAQGIPPFEAAQCGVFIHGSIGDINAENLGHRGLIASDILKEISKTIKKYECN